MKHIPITNGEFLDALYFGLPEDAAVAGARVRDLSGAWTADPLKPGQDYEAEEGQNAYFCISSHKNERPFHRTKQSFRAFHVLMLDDVGTKAPREAIRLKATYAIETSPGNFQLGFKLKEPLTDLATVKRLEKAAIDAGLSDPGASGFATRFARLPQGWNTKRNLSWQCGLVTWRPELAYTLEELLEGLGIELAPPKPKPQAKPCPRINVKPYVKAAVDAECDAVANATEGNRNARLNEAAFAIGRYVGGGEIQEDDAQAVLEQAAAACGLGEIEAEKTIRSGLEAGMAEPRSAPEDPDNTPASGPPSQWPAFVPFEESPPDLPPGILPGILGRFAEGLAEATQTPRELSAVNVLGVVALAVQHRLIVRVKFDYVEGVNLYALVASEPGERKSAIVSACKAPLVEWETQQERRALAAIQEAISHRKTLEKAIEKARAKAANAKDAEARKQATREVYDMERELPEVPPLPRLLVDDCTPEAMAEVMAGNGESIGMLEAEGGALDTLAGRYSQGVPNLDLVLKGYSGEPVAVDRKNRPPIRLRNPRITMILTPQPSVLRAAGSNQVFMGRGFIGRCLLVLPRPLVGYRDNDKTMPEHLTREWHAYVDSLLTIPAQPDPYELTLTKGAYALWLDFSRDVEHAQRPGGEFEFIRAWASKATGLVVRIAGLFHLAEGPGVIGEPIRPETMKQAIRFTAWAAIHAKYAFSSFGMDEGQEAGKRALEWLRREHRDAVTANEIYQAIRGRFPKMEQVRPGIKVLVDRGALVPRDQARRPGRPSDVYDVNPAIFGGDYGTC
jgi:hypothetical protein